MATADALAALMRSRRSVRRYKDREVDRKLLERVVEMAASAPMGIPPWDVGCVIVCGRDKVRELAQRVGQRVRGIPENLPALGADGHATLHAQGNTRSVSSFHCAAEPGPTSAPTAKAAIGSFGGRRPC